VSSFTLKSLVCGHVMLYQTIQDWRQHTKQLFILYIFSSLSLSSSPFSLPSSSSPFLLLIFLSLSSLTFQWDVRPYNPIEIQLFGRTRYIQLTLFSQSLSNTLLPLLTCVLLHINFIERRGHVVGTSAVSMGVPGFKCQPH
jgi:hypothetical protein